MNKSLKLEELPEMSRTSSGLGFKVRDKTCSPKPHSRKLQKPCACRYDPRGKEEALRSMGGFCKRRNDGTRSWVCSETGAWFRV